MSAPNADTMESAIALDVWLQIRCNQKDLAQRLLVAAFGTTNYKEPAIPLPSFKEWLKQVESLKDEPVFDIQHLASYPSTHDQRFHIRFSYDNKAKRYEPKFCYYVEGLDATNFRPVYLVWLVFESWSMQQGMSAEDERWKVSKVLEFVRVLQGHKFEAIRRYAEGLEREISRAQTRARKARGG